VTDTGAGTVTRVDSATAKRTGGPVQVGDKARGLVAAEGSVWVANSGDDTVSRIDSSDLRVVGSAINVGDSPRVSRSRVDSSGHTRRCSVTRVPPLTGRLHVPSTASVRRQRHDACPRARWVFLCMSLHRRILPCSGGSRQPRRGSLCSSRASAATKFGRLDARSQGATLPETGAKAPG
jgi:hypothetical protein